ncbi:Aste57867_15323 [Aphanomyces stellatus]|uniref:Aste57867_15323 protein n=1 Tax=Aphanomyces stellatus TaxID=120398 RepID=A0A485L477_9STRA|nr:hypothetical protein As57867_015267 [Aphanomyces stellatus]VFT92132.1 Aste57867_15323 [Aphanomyces stellatus]
MSDWPTRQLIRLVVGIQVVGKSMPSDDIAEKPEKGHKKYSLAMKVEIIREWEASGLSKYAIAKKHGMQTSQLTQWVLMKNKLTECAAKNPDNFTTHGGRVVTKPQVEDQLLQFYHDRRREGILVRPKMLIEHALLLDPTFHGGSSKSLSYWVYRFLERHNLAKSCKTSHKRARAKPAPRVQPGEALTAPLFTSDEGHAASDNATVPSVRPSKKSKLSHLVHHRTLTDPPSPQAVSPKDAFDGLLHCKAACREARAMKASLGDQYFSALEMLADVRTARMFIILPEEDRLEWLRWRLDQGSNRGV